MSNEMIQGISVVIPTIGRKSLAECVESVLSQELKPSQVIIVVDISKGTLTQVSNLIPKHNLIEIYASLKAGPSSARNVGILNSRAKYISFIDDDDLWVESKLRNQLEVIQTLGLNEKDSFVLSSRAIYVTDKYAFCRPSEAYNGNNILKSLYKVSWKKTDFCIPTPTIFLPATLARDNLFEEELQLREDIHWLVNLESKGSKIIQTKDVSVLVKYEPVRSWANETISNIWKSFRIIHTQDKKSAWKFVISVGIRSLILKKLVNIRLKIEQRISHA